MEEEIATIKILNESLELFVRITHKNFHDFKKE